ncbi:MAG: AAA family ATPase [Elusimicrobia bacterium]|nr:AAA family ATPase [Elusimicrobiota bacterium]
MKKLISCLISVALITAGFPWTALAEGGVKAVPSPLPAPIFGMAQAPGRRIMPISAGARIVRDKLLGRRGSKDVFSIRFRPDVDAADRLSGREWEVWLAERNLYEVAGGEGWALIGVSEGGRVLRKNVVPAVARAVLEMARQPFVHELEVHPQVYRRIHSSVERALMGETTGTNSSAEKESAAAREVFGRSWGASFRYLGITALGAVPGASLWKADANNSSSRGAILPSAWNQSEETVDTVLAEPRGQQFKMMKFSPDSLRLITVNEWGTVHIWDTGTGRLLKSIRSLEYIPSPGNQLAHETPRQFFLDGQTITIRPWGYYFRKGNRIPTALVVNWGGNDISVNGDKLQTESPDGRFKAYTAGLLASPELVLRGPRPAVIGPAAKNALEAAVSEELSAPAQRLEPGREGGAWAHFGSMWGLLSRAAPFLWLFGLGLMGLLEHFFAPGSGLVLGAAMIPPPLGRKLFWDARQDDTIEVLEDLEQLGFEDGALPEVAKAIGAFYAEIRKDENKPRGKDGRKEAFNQRDISRAWAAAFALQYRQLRVVAPNRRLAAFAAFYRALEFAYGAGLEYDPADNDPNNGDRKAFEKVLADPKNGVLRALARGLKLKVPAAAKGRPAPGLESFIDGVIQAQDARLSLQVLSERADKVPLPETLMPGQAPPLLEPSGAALRSFEDMKAQFVTEVDRGGQRVRIESAWSVLRHITTAVRLNLPALAVGPTGTGKSAAIKWLAAVMGVPHLAVAMKPSSGKDELMGSINITPKGLAWQWGYLVKAIANGDWVTLEEVNLAPTEVLEFLNEFLNSGFVRLTQYLDPETLEHVLPRELYESLKENGFILKPHPRFRLFMTMNPASYAARNKLAQTLTNRSVQLWVPDYSPVEIRYMLEARFGIEPGLALTLVESIYEPLKNMVRSGRLGKGWKDRYEFNLRTLLRVTGLYKENLELYAQAHPEKPMDERTERLLMARALWEGIGVTMRGDVDRKVLWTLFNVALGLKKKYGITQEEVLPRVRAIRLDRKRREIVFDDALLPLRLPLRPGGAFVPPEDFDLPPTQQTLNHIYWYARRMLRGQNRLSVGETSAGKTTMVQYIHRIRHAALFYTNLSSDSADSDIGGGYEPDPGSPGEFRFAHGLLKRAGEEYGGEGSTLAIDEFNFNALVEYFNTAMDDGYIVTPVGKVKLGPQTSIDALMNPPSSQGRSMLSPALRGRFWEIWIEEPDQKEATLRAGYVLRKFMKILGVAALFVGGALLLGPTGALASTPVAAVAQGTAPVFGIAASLALAAVLNWRKDFWSRIGVHSRLRARFLGPRDANIIDIYVDWADVGRLVKACASLGLELEVPERRECGHCVAKGSGSAEALAAGVLKLAGRDFIERIEVHQAVYNRVSAMMAGERSVVVSKELENRGAMPDPQSSGTAREAFGNAWGFMAGLGLRTGVDRRVFHSLELSDPLTIQVGDEGSLLALHPSRDLAATVGEVPDDSSSRDNHVSLWDSRTGARIKTLDIAEKKSINDIHSLGFSPDGGILAVAVRSGWRWIVRLWNTRTWKPLRRFIGIRAFAFSPDSKALFLVGNKQMRLVESGSWRTIWSGRARASTFEWADRRRPAFSPDGKRIALKLKDEVIHLLDSATGRWIASPAPPGKENLFRQQNLSGFQYSPDGRTAAAILYGNWLLVGDAQTGRKRKSFLPPFRRSFDSLAWHPDGRLLVAVPSKDAGPLIFRVGTWQVEEKLPVQNGPSAAAFSGDGRRLAIKAGGELTIWRMQNEADRAAMVEGELIHGAERTVSGGGLGTARDVFASAWSAAVGGLWRITIGMAESASSAVSGATVEDLLRESRVPRGKWAEVKRKLAEVWDILSALGVAFGGQRALQFRIGQWWETNLDEGIIFIPLKEILKHLDNLKVLIGAILHEAGHVFYTRLHKLAEYMPFLQATGAPEAVHTLFNVLDDMYLEHAESQRLPGAPEYLESLHAAYRPDLFRGDLGLAKELKGKPMGNSQEDQVKALFPHEEYLDALRSFWMTRQFPAQYVNPEVARAVQATAGSVESILDLLPEAPTPSEAELLELSRRRFDLIREKIAPRYLELIELSRRRLEEESLGNPDQIIGQRAERIAEKLAPSHGHEGHGPREGAAAKPRGQRSAPLGKPESSRRSGRPAGARPIGKRAVRDIINRHEDVMALVRPGNFYEQSLSRIFHLIDGFVGRIDNLFAKNSKPGWEGFFSKSPGRVNIRRFMAGRARGWRNKGDFKFWERRRLPTKRDYKARILIDLSGSMGGSKLERTLDLVAWMMESYERLGIDYSIMGFADDVYLFKDFAGSPEQVQPLSSDEKESIFAKVRAAGKGGTNDVGGVLAALQGDEEKGFSSLEDQDVEFRSLVVVTDGEGNGKNSDQMGAALAQAAEKRVSVIGIGIGEGMSYVKERYPGAHVLEPDMEHMTDAVSGAFERELERSFEVGVPVR